MSSSFPPPVFELKMEGANQSRRSGNIEVVTLAELARDFRSDPVVLHVLPHRWIGHQNLSSIMVANSNKVVPGNSLSRQDTRIRSAYVRYDKTILIDKPFRSLETS